MITVFEVNTQTHCICKEDDEYIVMASTDFDEQTLTIDGYEVIYKSTNYQDALLWLKDHLRS